MAKTRQDLEAEIIQKAWVDESFREDLKRNAKSIYTQDFSGELPKGAELRIVEEDERHLYLVIPDEAPDARQVELSERSSRDDFENALMTRAAKEASFRAELLADPKGAYQALLSGLSADATLPEDLTVEALQESDNVRYLRIPQAPAHVVEMSEAELEQVAGGASSAGGETQLKEEVAIVVAGIAIESTVAVAVVVGIALL
jgi:hypothetical protein